MVNYRNLVSMIELFVLLSSNIFIIITRIKAGSLFKGVSYEAH